MQRQQHGHDCFASLPSGASIGEIRRVFGSRLQMTNVGGRLAKLRHVSVDHDATVPATVEVVAGLRFEYATNENHPSGTYLRR